MEDVRNEVLWSVVPNRNDMLWLVEPIFCSLCGRRSNGASFVHGVMYPICRDGNYSCFEFHMKEHGRSPAQYRVLALSALADRTQAAVVR